MSDSTSRWFKGNNGVWYDTMDAASDPNVGGGFSGVQSTPNNPINGSPNSATQMTADQLVNQTLLQYKSDLDYNNQPFWQGEPQAVKDAAYSQIKNILSTPQTMADYVKTNNIQNLQSYAWWSNSPNSTAAYNIIQNSPAIKVAPDPAGYNFSTTLGSDSLSQLQTELDGTINHQKSNPSDPESGPKIAWLNAQIANIQNPTSSTTSTPVNTTSPTSTTAAPSVTSTTPSLGSTAVYNANDPMFDTLKQNAAYNSLTPDLQNAVKYSYFLMGNGTADDQKRFISALSVAGASSNNEMAQQFRELSTVLTNFVADTTQDYQFKADTLQNSINEINARMGDASIDEQASLNRQKLSYENQLTDAQNQMAGRGISSSSVSDRAQATLAAQNSDINESTTNTYNRTIRADQLQNSQYQIQQQQDQALKDRALRDKFQSTEATYGTNIANQLSSLFGGGQSMGDTSASYIDPATGKLTTGTLPIAGTYQDTRAQDLMTRTNAIMSGSTPIVNNPSNTTTTTSTYG